LYNKDGGSETKGCSEYYKEQNITRNCTNTSFLHTFKKARHFKFTYAVSVFNGKKIPGTYDPALGYVSL
jgi:hypothetical protein